MDYEPSKRGPRVNAVQKDCLVDYMLANANFAAGRFVGPNGMETSRMMWTQLVHQLNLKGPDKTIAQWQKVWKDIKANVKSKMAAIRADQNRTGNFPDGSPPLSEIEKKVLAILGSATVIGARGVDDSLPQTDASLLKIIGGVEPVMCEENHAPATVYEILDNDDGIIDDPSQPGESSSKIKAAYKPKQLANTDRDHRNRLAELLVQQNSILERIAQAGEKRASIAEEMLAIKRQKLAILLETKPN